VAGRYTGVKHALRFGPSVTKDAINAPTAGRSLSMGEQRLSMKQQSPSVDVVIMSLFYAHISIINSERQAIWQGYAAMLVANAIILGVFSREQALTTLQMYSVSGFGLALCMAWLVLTTSGFRTLFMRLDASRHSSWSQVAALDEYANPFNVDAHWAQMPRGRWMFGTAVFVIVLFMLAYVLLLAHHVYYTVVFFEGPR
jgi:hypothetical protein